MTNHIALLLDRSASMQPLAKERQIAIGQCQCGCGRDTKPAPRNRKSSGWVKGQPIPYVHGHHRRGKSNGEAQKAAAAAAHWKGGRTMGLGYTLIYSPEHPKIKRGRKYIQEHVLVAESALGRHLPAKAVVHHINDMKSDNRNSNLVICQDQQYHMLLHKRADALRVCGNAAWLRCSLCSRYDDPSNLIVKPRNSGAVAYHRTKRGTCVL